MNLSQDKRCFQGGTSRGGDGIGAVAYAAPAQLSVGAVGFGPTWQDDEPSLRPMYESACQTIVRLECEADELRAEVALLQEQARIVAEERDEARMQYRSTHTLAEVMVKSRNEFLEALRDIAKMDTSQEASGGQCAAVWRAMEALK